MGIFFLIIISVVIIFFMYRNHAQKQHVRKILHNSAVYFSSMTNEPLNDSLLKRARDMANLLSTKSISQHKIFLTAVRTMHKVGPYTISFCNKLGDDIEAILYDDEIDSNKVIYYKSVIKNTYEAISQYDSTELATILLWIAIRRKELSPLSADSIHIFDNIFFFSKKQVVDYYDKIISIEALAKFTNEKY